MDDHRKKMQTEWTSNTETYSHPIGMTGRKPDETAFAETIKDVSLKLKLSNPGIQMFLDAGCNNGYLLKRLAPDIPGSIGLDFCFQPLLEGRSLHSSMHFTQGEISQLPFPDNCFDRVLCFSLFHYLPSHEVAEKSALELFRVLKPGGRLVLGDLLSSEHKHLIPKDDYQRWNSPERPYMHQLQNWTFVVLSKLEQRLKSVGAASAVSQLQVRTHATQYRFDMVIDKQE